ncbi:MAG: hypothetical protein U0905_05960 [Pirellulales bacterium]
MSTQRVVRVAILVILLGISCGCEPEFQVNVYRAPKRVDPVAEPAKPKRSLAAVIPHETSVFYLKAMEDPARLEGLFDPFVQLTKDVTFHASGKPVWKLPEGWSEKPGTGIAIANIEAPAEGKPVVFAVTQLALPEGDWDRYLEDNLNRWRDQLSLPRLPLAEQKSQLKEIAREGGEKSSYVVDLVGTASGSRGPMMGGPMMGGSTPTPPPREPGPPKQSPLKFDVPEGWVEKPAGQFRLAVFEVGTGDRQAEVTVSAAKTDPKGNAIMWQGQLMQQGDEKAIEQAAMAAMEKGTPITSRLGEGSLYLFRESEKEDAQAFLIGVIPIKDADASLFVKMRGAANLLEGQRDKMIGFIASMKVEEL